MALSNFVIRSNSASKPFILTTLMSEKTFIYTPEAGYGRDGFDPNLFAALNNGGGFGGNGFNSPFWALILLAFLRNGFGLGDGNGSCTTGFVASQLNQAIAGNANAISNLATSLNCSIGQVQSGLNAIQSSVASVANQVGMSGQAVINAVNSGDATIVNSVQSAACQLGNKVTSCCCELKDSITKQGYENQLATLNQTNTLAGKIDAQTTFLSDKFCELEKRELQNRIDALREANTTLKGQIDNAAQTQQIQGFVAASVQPVATAVAGLQSDVDKIKCKLPETATIPYSPVVGIPSCVAYNAGLYGNFGFPFGTNGAGIFG